MKNEVAKILRLIAWIVLVLGTVAAFILLVTSSFTVALICWGCTIVSGAIILGLSEVIHLLQTGFSDIAPYLEEIRNQPADK